mmetsp:Transcript_80460/g.217914  ORF Transcript_80460/g.217914 Transcript_80460/m.217914 type:complete len:272 (-) Transcript_80460:43-858(-)
MLELPMTSSAASTCDMPAAWLFCAKASSRSRRSARTGEGSSSAPGPLPGGGPPPGRYCAAQPPAAAKDGGALSARPPTAAASVHGSRRSLEPSTGRSGPLPRHRDGSSAARTVPSAAVSNLVTVSSGVRAHGTSRASLPRPLAPTHSDGAPCGRISVAAERSKLNSSCACGPHCQKRTGVPSATLPPSAPMQYPGLAPGRAVPSLRSARRSPGAGSPPSERICTSKPPAGPRAPTQSSVAMRQRHHSGLGGCAGMRCPASCQRRACPRTSQ